MGEERRKEHKKDIMWIFYKNESVVIRETYLGGRQVCGNNI